MAKKDKGKEQEGTDQYSRAQFFKDWSTLDVQAKIVLAGRMALRVQPLLAAAGEKLDASQYVALSLAPWYAVMRCIVREDSRAVSAAAHAADAAAAYADAAYADAYAAADTAAAYAAYAARAAAYAAYAAYTGNSADYADSEAAVAAAVDAAEAGKRRFLFYSFWQQTKEEILQLTTRDVAVPIRVGALARSPLWFSANVILDVVQFVDQWRKLLSTKGDKGESLARLYHSASFNQIDFEDLQKLLYGDVLVPASDSLDGQGSSVSREIVREEPLRLPEADCDIDRWGTLIFRACLLNREFLKHLSQPTSAKICEIVSEVWELANTEMISSARLSQSSRHQGRTESSASTPPETEQPLTKMERYVHQGLAEKARQPVGISEGFLPPKIWLAWLRNTQADVMDQFFQDVVNIILNPSSEQPQ